MTESEKKQTGTSLAAKLAKAMESIGAVNKDGENNFQRYKFQSEAAIKGAVKKAITEVGIVIIPNYEIISQEERVSEKGKTSHFVDVMGTFTITDGTEELVGKMPGSGQDTAEKAVQKACTSAQKYFYKQLFNITDQEDDPDSENSEPATMKPKYTVASQQQVAMITEGFKQMNQGKQGAGDSAKKYFFNEYHVKSVNELSAEQAKALIKIISDKVSAYAQEKKKPESFDNAFAQ
ncbi:ERF family protein [Latilactobacillus sakei]